MAKKRPAVARETKPCDGSVSGVRPNEGGAGEREPGGDSPVLRRSSLDEMFTPQLRAADGEGGSGTDVQAGLSSFIERHGGVELVGHSGDQNGFISHFYVHLPSRLGYIVAFNTQTTSAKAGDKRNTRALDAALRDVMVKAVFR